MILLPYRQLRITSARPAAEVCQRLQSLTAPKQPWFRSLLGKFEFVGKITPGTFRIVPVVRGQNTYLPWVFGSVRDHDGGSEILLTQTLHPVAVAAVLGLFGCLEVASVVHGDLGSATFVGAALLLFHIVMYYIGFVPEARRVETRIAEVAG